MQKMPWDFRVPALAAACMLVCLQATAQTIQTTDGSHTVAVATQAAPVEESFTISTVGTYKVTLTDFGAASNLPLSSAQLAVNYGTTVVGTLTSTSGQASWSTTFNAASTGTYSLHVVGVPGAIGSGSIGLAVTSVSDGTAVTLPFYSANLTLPNTGVSSQFVDGYFIDTFQVPSTGSYVITLTDMQLPAALTELTAGVTNPSDPTQTLVTTLSADTAPNTPTATAQVNLTQGVSYQIFAGGQALTSVGAGLYGVNITPAGGGAAAYSHTVTVGTMAAIASPNLTSGTYTLTLADLKAPSVALTQVDAAVTLNGQAVSELTAAGTASPFTVSASATYQVFAFGTAAASSQGSYALTLQPSSNSSGAPIVSVARGVSDPASGIVAYSYDTSIVTPEAYAFNLADFGYPASLTSLAALAVQSGAQLGTTLTSAGQTSVTPAAGPLSLLVFAQPAATASNNGVPGGLFGLDLQASGAATPAFQASQGVGNLFSVQTVSISKGGYYQAQVADLKFPAAFANLSVVVTQGITLVGKNFGGTLTFNATSGDYLVNMITTPDSTAGAGTYSLVVGAVPNAASVSLQAASTTVTSGSTVQLSYTLTNITSCTAASNPTGSWSGTITQSGSFTTQALTTTTTFTLTCTGADGTTQTGTATVNVTPGTPTGTGSKNGGGAIDTSLLALLLGGLALRLGARSTLMRRIH